VIKPGEEWGTPSRADPDLEVAGRDRDLAAAVAAHPGALIRFRGGPGSDVARAVGIATSITSGVEVALDALVVDGRELATNMVVAGAPPDRLRRFSRRIPVTVTVDGTEWFRGDATTVVVATGQFLRGLDVVPRGHPGDGRAEVQAYAPAPGERRRLRARLGTGTHVPHPRIAQRAGRQISIRWDRPQPLELDGDRRGTAAAVTVEVVPGAYRLLV
jgi:hypothetical protein